MMNSYKKSKTSSKKKKKPQVLVKVHVQNRNMTRENDLQYSILLTYAGNQ
jgi:hypothetical protein